MNVLLPVFAQHTRPEVGVLSYMHPQDAGFLLQGMQLARLVPPCTPPQGQPSMAHFAQQLRMHIMGQIPHTDPVDLGRLAVGLGALRVPGARAWMPGLLARMDTLNQVDSKQAMAIRLQKKAQWRAERHGSANLDKVGKRVFA